MPMERTPLPGCPQSDESDKSDKSEVLPKYTKL